MEQILKGFLTIRGVKAAVIVDNEGKKVSAQVDGIQEEELDKATCIAVKAMEEAIKIGEEFILSDILHSIIEFSDYILAIERISPENIFLVISDKQASLGRIKYEIKKCKMHLK